MESSEGNSSQQPTGSREQLNDIMKNIHEQCIRYGDEDGFMNYVKGANLAGFVKVADAMMAYGAI